MIHNLIGVSTKLYKKYLQSDPEICSLIKSRIQSGYWILVVPSGCKISAWDYLSDNVVVVNMTGLQNKLISCDFSKGNIVDLS